MKNKFFRSLVKCSGALLVSLALWEVVLRLAFIAPIAYHEDERFGWMPPPYSAGKMSLEGWGYVRFNELGFRDSPLKLRRPGEVRILCLGDSYTLGAQMSVDKSFPYLLQTLLQQTDPASVVRAANIETAVGASLPTTSPVASGALPPVRVFNAGRDATTVAYSIGLADQYKRVFQPDWTVVQVRDGWAEIFSSKYDFRPVPDGDTFRIQRVSHLEKMSPNMRRLLRWHIRDFALFQYGRRHFEELKEKPVTEGGEGAGDSPGDTQDAASGGTGQESQEKGLKAIGWSLTRLKALYPRLLIVHVPFGSPAQGGLLPTSPEEKKLVLECRRQQIPLIAMRSYFEQDYARSHLASIGFANTIPWTGHPNARGHALIALALHDYLAPRIKSWNSDAHP